MDVNRYENHESPHVRNRAKIVLLTEAGQSAEAIADEVGLAVSTVKKWQSAWEKDGLAIFPELPEAANDEDEDEDESEAIEIISDTGGDDDTGDEKPPYGLTFPEMEPLNVTDSMLEAGRKVMLRQLEIMLSYELLARKGEDIEGVHQMRVATRRWRSTYDILGDYLPKNVYKSLRRTTQRLGDARDLDVFLKKTHHYINTQCAGDKGPLHPLLKAMKKRRKRAQKKLLRWLGKEDYRRFVKQSFSRLEEPITIQLNDRLDRRLPVMIYARFEVVRQYDDVLDKATIETLHELRKDCKRLRYMLDTYAEVLGSEAETVISELKDLQDHLGDLNDAEVAIAMIGDVEKELEKSKRAPLKAYRKYREAELENLFSTFPEAWAKFDTQTVRQALGRAISAL